MENREGFAWTHLLRAAQREVHRGVGGSCWAGGNFGAPGNRSEDRNTKRTAMAV